MIVNVYQYTFAALALYSFVMTAVQKDQSAIPLAIIGGLFAVASVL